MGPFSQSPFGQGAQPIANNEARPLLGSGAVGNAADAIKLDQAYKQYLMSAMLEGGTPMSKQEFAQMQMQPAL